MESHNDSDLPPKYSLDEDKFAESESIDMDGSAIFYGSMHSKVKDRKTKKTYFKVEIPRDNIYNFAQRYINFIYIIGNNPPFGKFKGYSQDEKKFCPYFEYDPNKTLQNILQEDFEEDILTDTVKSETIFAVAAALEYCHTMGVSCRFIHPESIFYDDKNRPNLTNFGYSESILNSPNIAFNSKMTNLKNPLFQDMACYIAPELLNDSNAFSFQSDIYSFGTLLYSIVTKKKLFEVNTKEEILDLIKHKRYPQIQEGLCSSKLIKIINKCHSENPNERYTSSEILKILISTKTPLFKDCDMIEYKDYQKEILHNTYINFEGQLSLNDCSQKIYAFSSRLLKDRLNQKQFSKKEKKDICTVIRVAAKKGFSPAIYKYAEFLDSNIESYLELDLKFEFYDPFVWMKRAADAGVYDACLKLGEMYERRGRLYEAEKIFDLYKEKNEQCQIKLLISPKPPLSYSTILTGLKKSLNPDVLLETELFEATKHVQKKITEDDRDLFVRKVTDLSKRYKSGKPYYYLAIFYRDGEISLEIERGTDGYLTVSKKKCEPDSYEIFSPSSSTEQTTGEYSEFVESKNKYMRALELAADRLYEPAVAEYSVCLINEYLSKKNEKSLKKAEEIIERFFIEKSSRFDSSKTKIQHAYALLREVIGKKNNDLELVKKALRLFKETADGGLLQGIVDYLRLYQEGDDQNKLVIKYYNDLLDQNDS